MSLVYYFLFFLDVLYHRVSNLKCVPFGLISPQVLIDISSNIKTKENGNYEFDWEGETYKIKKIE